MVRIKFLGTGTSYPTSKRVSSSCLIFVDEKKLLLDIGPGVLRRLTEMNIPLEEIDIVFLTHFHVDHSSDLPAFLFSSNYGMGPRKRPLFIIGGDGVKSFFSKLCKAYPWIKPKTYTLTILKLVNRSYEWNGILISTKRVNHNKESIAIRLDTSVSLVFTGDTDFSKNLIEISRGVDLLITECSFPWTKIKGHMNLETVKKVVCKAKPKEVILTHLYPEWDEIKCDKLAPFRLAEDGMEIVFGD